MSVAQEIDGPFPFSQTDLEPNNLLAGVRHTLAHFFRWRDGNPATIAEHVNRYTRQLDTIAGRRRISSVIGRRTLPVRRLNQERARIAREVNYFAVYNLGEVPDAAMMARITAEFHGRERLIGSLIAATDRERPFASLIECLEQQLPVLKNVPETQWLGQRLEALHRMLPEAVIQAGGMGKVIRALTGVLTIGAYDTLDLDPAARKQHMARLVPGAYALGAAYVIIDDTLQDLPGDYISARDRERYHGVILRGLSTGRRIDANEVPDHPLAEEMHSLHELLLESYPFHEFRHLYHAAEAMYLAQHRDSTRTADDLAADGLATMYEDILIKSGMSRIVANILARRQVGERFYARCLNTIFLGQFKDDLRDRVEDQRANRLTPFTVVPDSAGANPLYDLFAYDAYVVSEVFDGDPAAGDALTYFGAVKLATHLSAGQNHLAELTNRYELTSEMARCLRAAADLPLHAVQQLESVDTRIKDHYASVLNQREQTTVESRTFIADRMAYINEVTKRCYPGEGATGLDQIVAYAMEAPGKRLRPALGLMLAETLGIDTTTVEPFVAASELFHTASLLLDDLPAQDNATLRRGRPTAHTVFDEGSVQLAAVSMISTGFGMLAELGRVYPAQRVTEVIAYVGTVLGPTRLCKGQDIDLHMGKSGRPVDGAEILEMYELKTSTTIEAALVPLMMLVDRPATEIELVERYARHAGIVFQIRDDILDLTSTAESIGKDTENDVGKVNVVRAFGLAEAQRLMRDNLDAALDCCARLPFDTRLLEGMVTHFATRRK